MNLSRCPSCRVRHISEGGKFCDKCAEAAKAGEAYTGIREYLGDLPPPVPYPDPRIPPTPKYAIGDVIFFDRTDSDYGKEKEGKVVGTVSAIELYQGNYATKCGSVTIPAMAWKVSYWTVENDDEIPERCVLHRLVKDLTNG